MAPISKYFKIRVIVKGVYTTIDNVPPPPINTIETDKWVEYVISQTRKQNIIQNINDLEEIQYYKCLQGTDMLYCATVWNDFSQYEMDLGNQLK